MIASDDAGAEGLAAGTGEWPQVDSRLAGRVAIVTGGGMSSHVMGLGAATSLVLADRGAAVAIVDISQRHAEATAEAIAERGGTSRTFLCDVSDDQAVQRTVEAITQEFGGVDILVNNAGIVRGGGVDNVVDANWRMVLAVNLTGPMIVSRAAYPYLEKSDHGGVIINIASVSGLRASGDVAYTASKAGLIGMTQDMAYTLGPHGIRVNAIAPGHIFSAVVERGGEAVREARRRAAPLDRQGDAWDVAWAVAFLASDEARFISGVVLPVDGGATSVLPLAMMPRMVPGAPEVSDFIYRPRAD